MGLYQQMKRKLDTALVFEEKNTALIMLEAVFAGIVLQLTWRRPNAKQDLYN